MVVLVVFIFRFRLNDAGLLPRGAEIRLYKITGVFFPDLCLARNISSLQRSGFFFGDFHLAFIMKIKK